MRRILFVVLLTLGALLLSSRVTAAEEPVSAYATGFVETTHGQLITGATVCIKQSGTTTCVKTNKGLWQIDNLRAGTAELAVICVPFERDNMQKVRTIDLPAGRYYDGLFRSTCFWSSAIGPCPGGVFPPEPSAPCPHDTPPPCSAEGCHPTATATPTHRPVAPVVLAKTGGAEAASFWEPIPTRGWLYLAAAVAIAMLIGVYIGRHSR
jgi:hypothetical protein